VDDGHVIASMNVEGMPWYTHGNDSPLKQEQQQLSRYEFRHVLLGALGASLLVAGVLSAGVILFVLFCTEIWLK